jgi:hypothetical protein
MFDYFNDDARPAVSAESEILAGSVGILELLYLIRHADNWPEHLFVSALCVLVALLFRATWQKTDEAYRQFGTVGGLVAVGAGAIGLMFYA